VSSLIEAGRMPAGQAGGRGCVEISQRWN